MTHNLDRLTVSILTIVLPGTQEEKVGQKGRPGDRKRAVFAKTHSFSTADRANHPQDDARHRQERHESVAQGARKAWNLAASHCKRSLVMLADVNHCRAMAQEMAPNLVHTLCATAQECLRRDAEEDAAALKKKDPKEELEIVVFVLAVLHPRGVLTNFQLSNLYGYRLIMLNYLAFGPCLNFLDLKWMVWCHMVPRMPTELLLFGSNSGA